MTGWTDDQLAALARSTELRISTPRRDGTDRPLIPIWSVIVDGELYVRSYLGERGAWYRGAIAHRCGRIAAPGVDAAVVFERADADGLAERIDAAYAAKHAGSPYLPPMLEPAARTAALRVLPLIAQ